MGRFFDALNEQVANEYGASQQYVALAVYYDSQTLPRLAAHFYRQAVEERNHAMMIVQFILDSDRTPVIPGVDAPRTEFANATEPVEIALAQEKKVTEQIAALVQLARQENELVGEQFLHWFLEEQREEMSSMSSLLDTVRRASEQNLLLVEDYLARTVVGDEGASPHAPPAAGGAL